MSNSENQPSSFFGRKMTSRHLLTRWISGAAGVTCLALVTWFYPFGQGDSEADSLLNSSGESENKTIQSVGLPRVLKVSTAELKAAGPDFLTQKYTGVVAARRSSQLAAKAVGRIESVSVDLGDATTQGQVLIQLDQEQLVAQRAIAMATLAAAKSQLEELEQGPRRQDIEQAESQVAELQASLKLSEANFRRNSQLRSASAISVQEYDESVFQLDAARSKLDAAVQALERLQEGTRREQIDSQRAVVDGLIAQVNRIDADLRDRLVIAPFDGFVQNRLVDEGTVVSPGQTLLELVESAPYEVRVGLPPWIVEDLTESNFSVLNGGRKLAASIERIAPAIQETTRTREVVLLLSDSSSRMLSIGSAVSVEIQSATVSQGFWVPTRALTAGPRGLWAVFVAVPIDASDSPSDTEHRIERRQVELLRANGEWSEIQGPLVPTEQLVVEGVHRITPGQRVECVSSDAFELFGKQ